MSEQIIEPPQDQYEDQDDLYTREEDEEVPTSKLSPPDRRLVTQPYDFSVKTIVDHVTQKSIDPHPSFQRGYVWDEIRASRLIESLLMNIPIPVCYFAEEENGNFTVIDGHQRLYSIWRFLNNHFRLKGLETLSEYNNLFFKDLVERDQKLIQGRYIRCIVITQDSHPEIRFEVFERLNSGAMSATDQEIRNSVYRGKFNDLIKSLANTKRWLNALGKTKLDKRMKDEELILRFFAINENYLYYKAPIRTFLSKYACEKTFSQQDGKNIRKKISSDEVAHLSHLFEETIDKVTAVFGEHAFRAYIDGEWEKRINRPLFDAITLVFSKLSLSDLLAKSSDIKNKLIELYKDDRFIQATSGSKAHKRSFVKRVKMFSIALSEIGLDSKVHEQLIDDE